MFNLNFYKRYIKTLNKTSSQINLKKIDHATNIILKAIEDKKNIFIAGNGGSAAIANHMLCDFNKGIKLSSKKKLIPKFISLSNSIEQITAISNDVSFEEIFKFQLENYLENDDIVILMSCSGTSKNIVKTLNYLENKKCKIIFFTGFQKKMPKKKIDVYINLKCKNYGITEDLFSTILHLISQGIRSKFTKKNEIL